MDLNNLADTLIVPFFVLSGLVLNIKIPHVYLPNEIMLKSRKIKRAEEKKCGFWNFIAI